MTTLRRALMMSAAASMACGRLGYELVDHRPEGTGVGDPTAVGSTVGGGAGEGNDAADMGDNSGARGPGGSPDANAGGAGLGGASGGAGGGRDTGSGGAGALDPDAKAARDGPVETNDAAPGDASRADVLRLDATQGDGPLTSSRRVFVSNATMANGSLGGVAMADALCQSFAD